MAAREREPARAVRARGSPAGGANEDGRREEAGARDGGWQDEIRREEGSEWGNEAEHVFVRVLACECSRTIYGTEN